MYDGKIKALCVIGISGFTFKAVVKNKSMKSETLFNTEAAIRLVLDYK